MQENLFCISTGAMEFSMNAHPDDFFPVRVSFMSKRPFCDIEVSAVVMSYSQHL